MLNQLLITFVLSAVLPAAMRGQEGLDDLSRRLVQAIVAKDVAGVNAAVAGGADINVVLAEGMSPGSTPLFMAASVGDPDIVEAMLFLGADVNHVAEDGTSALYWAIGMGHAAVARRLILAGASFQTADEFAVSFLKSEAERKGNAEIFDLMGSMGVKSLKEQWEDEQQAREEAQQKKMANLPQVEEDGSYPPGEFGGACSAVGEDNPVPGGTGMSRLVVTGFLEQQDVDVQEILEMEETLPITWHAKAQGDGVEPPECNPVVLPAGDWYQFTQEISMSWVWEHTVPGGCKPGVACFIRKRTTSKENSYQVTSFSTGVVAVADDDECRETPRVVIDSPADGDEFAFNAGTPGRVKVDLRARVSPEGCGDAEINWTVDDIAGSTTYLLGPDATESTSVGNELILIYEDLPLENLEFGEKTITATAGGNSQSVTIRVFFSPTATNHPVGPGDQSDTPNWYYYWSQTSAGGYAPRYEAERKSITTGGLAQAQYDYGDDIIVLTDRAFATSCYPRPGGHESKGIDCFGELVRHEGWHQKERHDWWGTMNPVTLPGVARRAYDTDLDFVPDSVESALESSRNCVVYDRKSCDGRPDEDMIDVEMNAYTKGWRWVVGSADKQDWSWCGKQWKDLAVCPGKKRW